MRTYRCFYKYKDNAGNFEGGSHACWSGITIVLRRDIPGEDKNTIFIYDFEEDEVSEESRARVITLINRITPCSFVKIDNIRYIRFKLLNNYYSNLVLLNFIRMFWYKPTQFDIDKYYKDIKKLKKKTTDTLVFMLTCVKNSVDEKATGYWGDHSLIYSGINPKTSKELIAYEGKSMESFLKQ